MLKSVIFFFLILVTLRLSAQTTHLNLAVSDQQGQAVSGATVLLKNTDSLSSKVYMTDMQGALNISALKAGLYYITIRHVAFLDTMFKVDLRGKSDLQRIILTRRSNELAEVKIFGETPISVKKDTLEYTTKYFKSGQEENLEDLAKKLPGLEVNDKGEIIYKGKKIEKITVDGREFFGNNIKMATKNIPANIIEKLQVIENYSDNNLAGNPGNSGKNALNIVLDETKRNIVFGNAGIGAGLNNYYQADLKSFYFNQKLDVGLISNLNNIGQEIFSTEDYLNFYGGVQNVVQSGAADQALKLPTLLFSDQDKAFRNKTLVSSLNLNYQPTNKIKINGFGIFSGNRSRFASQTLNTFLNNNYQLKENELSNVTKYISVAQLNFQYNPNPNTLIKYTFNQNHFDSDRDMELSTEILNKSFQVGAQAENSSSTITQQLSMHHAIDQTLILSGNVNFELRNTRQSYLAERAGAQILGDLLNLQMTDQQSLIQQQRERADKFDGQITLYKKFSKTDHLKLQLGYSKSNDLFHSAITLKDSLKQSVTLTAPVLSNNQDYDITDKNLGMYYIHQSGIFTYNAGINAHAYQFLDHSVRYFYQPDLIAKLSWRDSRQLRLNYKIENKLPNISEIVSGYTVEDYRTIHLGNDSLQNSLYHTITANYFDVNLYSFSHLNIFVSYSRKIRNIRNQTEIDNYGQLLRSANNSPENNLIGNINFSKKFSRKFELKAKASSMLNSFHYLINSSVFSYTSFELDQTLSWTSYIRKDFIVETGLQYKNDHYQTNALSTRFITTRPFVNVEYTMPYNFKFKSEYSLYSYKQAGTDQVNRYSLLTASVQKKIKKVTLLISGRNLINTQEIYRNSFNENRFSLSSYHILPRNLLLYLTYKF